MERNLLILSGIVLLFILGFIILMQIRSDDRKRSTMDFSGKALNRRIAKLKEDYMSRNELLRSFRNLHRQVVDFRNLMQKILTEYQSLFRQLEEGQKIRSHDLQIVEVLTDDVKKFEARYNDTHKEENERLPQRFLPLVKELKEVVSHTSSKLNEFNAAPLSQLNNISYLDSIVEAITNTYFSVKQIHSRVTEYMTDSDTILSKPVK